MKSYQACASKEKKLMMLEIAGILTNTAILVIITTEKQGLSVGGDMYTLRVLASFGAVWLWV